jgi:transposase
VFGRQLLVRRIVDEDWPVAQATDALGVSRATAYKPLARFRPRAGTGCSTAAPGPTARRVAAPELEAAIIRARVRRRQ